MITTIRMMNLSSMCDQCPGTISCPHLSLRFRFDEPRAQYLFTVTSKLNCMLKYRRTIHCDCALEAIGKDRNKTFSYLGHILDELITRADCRRQIGHNSPLIGKISHKDISRTYFETITLNREINDRGADIRITAWRDERCTPDIDISLLELLFMDVALYAADDILTLINDKVDSILRSEESLANRSRIVMLKQLLWEENVDFITRNNLGSPLCDYMSSMLPANIVDKTDYNIRLTNGLLVIDE